MTISQEIPSSANEKRGKTSELASFFLLSALSLPAPGGVMASPLLSTLSAFSLTVASPVSTCFVDAYAGSDTRPRHGRKQRHKTDHRSPRKAYINLRARH